MGKKLVLLSFLLIFANYTFALPKKAQLNRITQVLKKAKAVISGADIDFNHKVKIWFCKASNPSLFFYNKTEYVDLIKAINEHNIDKLDVLLADYALTVQAKEILLNHAERVVTSLEKEIITEITPEFVVIKQSASIPATPNQSQNATPDKTQSSIVDNSPKLSKLTMILMVLIACSIYSIEDKKINYCSTSMLRKDYCEISYLKPLLNTLKNPFFLISLLYFANPELIKRLEYRNQNKKVAVLPKALAVRDLILSAPITKKME